MKVAEEVGSRLYLNFLAEWTVLGKIRFGMTPLVSLSHIDSQRTTYQPYPNLQLTGQCCLTELPLCHLLWRVAPLKALAHLVHDKLYVLNSNSRCDAVTWG